HGDLNIQVTRWRSMHAGLSLTGQPNAITRINAGRNLHRQGASGLCAPLATTVPARVFDHLAVAMTGGAGLLHREKSLLHAHLPHTRAGRAGHRLFPRLGSGTTTNLAGIPGGHANLLLAAAHSLLKAQFQGVTQVGTARRT